jgi:hypothetical protein
LLGFYSVEEDAKLQDHVSRFGRKWKDLEQFFDGRSYIQLKNRYMILFRKDHLRLSKVIGDFGDDVDNHGNFDELLHLT